MVLRNKKREKTVLFMKDASTRINELYGQGLITSDLRDLLNAVRKAGNAAIHDNKGEVEQAQTLIEMTYGLCEWFYQAYGDWVYGDKKLQKQE